MNGRGESEQMPENTISVRVWGDWACFTRPEMKVERVSYPLMTPSAARGVLEAIFWEPQMYYVIDAIRVVRRGAWVSFRRNEVSSRISLQNAQGWMRGAREVTPVQAGGGAPDGTQRNMLALQGVEYIISAEARLTELGQKTRQPPQKYYEEITRRAKSGKCFHRPYLGVREFAADFEWEAEPESALKRRATELQDEWRAWADDDLGLMLYDLFDERERATGFRWLNAAECETLLTDLKPAAQKKLLKQTLWNAEGRHITPSAAFFRAHVRDNTLDCHPARVTLKYRNGGAN